ncbi:MAG: hypothetical protein JSS96_11785 [Bacteroidetes bacterium]|nr:hypothetical protein [Bacteroidota bacterium]
MKKYLILLVSFFAAPSYSQILVKVQLTTNETTGHLVVMYYALQNIDSVVNKVENLKTVKEAEFLKVWGMPLIEGNDVIDNCRIESIKYPKFKKVFKYKGMHSDRIEKIGTIINLEYVKIKNLKFCTIMLYGKYWADNNVIFTHAGLLTMENLSYDKFTNEEMNKIKVIKKSLQTLVENIKE